ncbi:MAG: hypothetical protein JEY91_16450, partial [Spirochaetaceae bacterium]|nr:hypothetical protein [Spirochaetaceae bacterium]
MKKYYLTAVFVFITLYSIFSESIGTFRLDHLTISDGLPHSSVSKIVQDSNGFMWFGTQSGLTKYDGYSFITYLNDPFDSNSLPHNLVQTMFLDKDDILWIGTYSGLSRLNIRSNKFVNYQSLSDDTSLSNDVVVAIERDCKGRLWVGTLNGLNLLDEESGTFTQLYHNPEDSGSLPDNTVRTIFTDKNDNLWIGTYGGLSKWDFENERFINFTSAEEDKRQVIERAREVLKAARGNPGTSPEELKKNKEVLEIALVSEIDTNTIPSNYIMDIKQSPFSDDVILLGTWKGQSSPGGVAGFNTKTEEIKRYITHDMRVYSIMADNDNRLWVGTWGGGLSILSLEDDTYEYYEQGSSSDLSHNVVYSLYQDYSGVIWIGTNGGGINKYVNWKNQYKFYYNDTGNPRSLPSGKVVVAFEDSQSRLWFGVQGSGLSLLNKEDDSFKNYSYDEEDETTLSNGIINTIFEDSSNNLWVGTNNGLNLYIDKSDSFKRIYADETGASLPENLIYTIIEDHDNNIWIGTYTRGLSVQNSQTGEYSYYRNDKDDPTSLSDNLIRSLFVDSTGKIWIATNKGLNLFLPESKSFQRFQHNKNDRNSLSSNDIRKIFEDKERNIWIATNGGGVNLYHRDTESFTLLSTLHGLLNNSVYGIEEDNKGNLLFITQAGISVYNKKEKSFSIIDQKTGLLSSELTSGYLKAHDGSFYIGSNEGITHIPYFEEQNFDYIPMIHINRISILGMPYENNATPPWELDELILKHDENTLSFEFTLSDYASDGQNQFAYKLEGVDSEWVFSGVRNFARYTQLKPGEYVFRVIGADSRNNWNEKGAVLNIVISPPFRQSVFAKIIYILLIILIIVLIFIRSSRKERETQKKIEEQIALNIELEGRVRRRTAQIEEAREIAEEATRAKSLFLANMSHELRTPLNAVIGFSALLNEDYYNSEEKHIISSIKAAGKSLSTLINDLLDLSKLEAGKLRIKPTPLRLRTFLFEIKHIFDLKVKEKKLNFSIDDDPQLPDIIIVDETRFRQILINLIGNAIKFTDSGAIRIAVRKLKNDKRGYIDLELSIADTGCGILQEEREKIFTIFWQNENNAKKKPSGTGLGLSITKNLIHLMNGEITVENNDEGGATFTVILRDIAFKSETENKHSE